MKTGYLTLIFALACAACTPRFYPPKVDVPDGYLYGEGFPRDTAALASDWWRLFGDTVLDNLVQRALENNRDVAVAASRVEEARQNLGVVRAQFLPQVGIGVTAEGEYTPTWPLPKLFRMTNKGKLSEGIFKGETINTPSMLCVEDALVSLNWIDSIGGVKASIARTNANAQVLFDWMDKSAWAQNLALVPATRSTTSICLTIKDPWFTSLPKDKQEEVPKKIVSLLDKEGVAYDIGAYRTAPLGLRIWTGATVEASDLQALCPWLDWAYEQAKASISTTL